VKRFLFALLFLLIGHAVSAQNPVTVAPVTGSSADNESNTEALLGRIGARLFVFDGATWDRWTGSVTISGTVAVTQSGTWTVQPGNTANTTAWLVTGTGGTFPATQSGTWNITNISGTVSLPTLASTSTKQSDGSQKTQIVDGSGNVIASTSNNLNVQCANCSGSGVSAADEATFTAGTSVFAAGGGFFQTTATNNALTNGQQGAFQLTSTRALFSNLRNAAGTEVGTSTTPLQVSLANTGANTSKLLVTPDSVALPANQSVNVSQINGVTPLMGAGNTGTGSPRVTLSTDQAALPGLGVYVEDAAETAGGNLSMAGTVRRDTAASSAGTTGDNATLNTDDTGKLWTRIADPCSAYDKTYAPFSISTATTTVVISASASNKNYICSLEIVVAGADNVALVEDATGSCASPDAGMAGGTTAATGWNFAANSGLARGNGNGTVYKTASTNVNTCLITSAAVQASGVIAYVQKP
jgi:hypothetical protein